MPETESFKVVDRRGEAKAELEPDQPIAENRAVDWPTCPYCKCDPCLPRSKAMNSPSFSAVAIFCPNPACRAIFNVQIVDVRKLSVPAMPAPGDPLRK